MWELFEYTGSAEDLKNNKMNLNFLSKEPIRIGNKQALVNYVNLTKINFIIQPKNYARSICNI